MYAVACHVLLCLLTAVSVRSSNVQSWILDVGSRPAEVSRDKLPGQQLTDGDSDFEPTACDACGRAVRGLMLPPVDTKRIQHSDNRISEARANQQEGHATFGIFKQGHVKLIFLENIGS